MAKYNATDIGNFITRQPMSTQNAIRTGIATGSNYRDSIGPLIGKMMGRQYDLDDIGS